jgi:endonuclease/exonuclease/phosphatase family metal-dependent hydrolase
VSSRSLPHRLTRPALRLAAAGTAGFAAVRLSGWDGGPYPMSALLAFTPYALAGAIATGVAAAVARDRAALAAVAVSGAVLAAAVVPRSVAATQPQASGPRVTITTANLLHGEADPAALAEIVQRRQSDVLALQELNQPAMRALRAAGVFDTLPSAILGPGQVHDDVGVAARWPVTALDAGLPTVYSAVTLEVPGYGPLPVVSAHPTPPVRPRAQRHWREWLAALPGPTGPLSGGLIAGDFNATLDHPQLRRLLGDGWRDAGRERGDALQSTWHGLPLTRLTLDHVLVPPGAAVEQYVVDDLRGSDHRAVTVTVRLPAR